MERRGGPPARRLAQQAAGDTTKLHGAGSRGARRRLGHVRQLPARGRGYPAWPRGPLMYNDAVEPSPLIDANAPPGHCTRSATSALAKLLHWASEKKLENEVICHQADYVASALSGDKPVLVSDWHNALKLGFDIDALEWPGWILERCLNADERNTLTRLRVTRPGDVCERVVSAEASEAWGLPAGVEVVGGTTDSIAAFVACATDIDKGALNVAAGDAVTSLGSTTALKLVSKTRVDDSSVGVYSHGWRTTGWWVARRTRAAACCASLRSRTTSSRNSRRVSTPQLLTGTASTRSWRRASASRTTTRAKNPSCLNARY